MIRKSRLALSVFLSVSAVALFALGVAGSANINVETMIRKCVAANEADWNASPNYEYTEADRIGAVTHTYQVMMIEGSPYRRLIALSNEPLSAQQTAAEQRKLQQVIATRKAESAGERERRIAKYEKERNRDHLMMTQLTQAFDFRLLGERVVDGQDVYMLRATPRKGYKPPNIEAQVLPGMRGELWLEKNTFKWVKVTATVTRPVSIEGFLARVDPGTRFELEKMPVGDGIWQAKHFSMHSSAKVLYLFNRTEQEDTTFFDYHKIGAAPATQAPGTGANGSAMAAPK